MNVPIRDVVNLQIGDVIRFNTTKVGDPLVLSVGSRKKFYCQPGVVGKQRAVQIIEKIKENDDDEFEELTAEGDDTL